MPPKYRLDKRQKELARKQKQERKQTEKAERKNQLPLRGIGKDPTLPD